MRYRRSFQVRAPFAAVVHFHRQSSSLAAITPPPVTLQLQQAPTLLDAGDEMEFTTGLGPLRIPWLARIEDVTTNGFSDVQLRGPFQRWVHHHSFISIDRDTTQVVDEIQATLRWDFPSVLTGLAMWLSLPLLFSYRACKTRHLLEQRAS